ncbi:putative trimethyllysine dioxygenase TmlH [Talaromyces proteolyticus]|uniref:Trimethyllysine dioxygenase TmlH n=1 Tax=Talaromyces proteolyticus TaxID=1131652 RepID=A0AAD4KLI7_9EURO|nr:putative trimethyllysine dioxygenase TmlH [Talaromyces proteolyticus]KAH8695389.1 putative trimethyllysine dioxygenase TmlH [Talaromyces proteolyticus]
MLPKDVQANAVGISSEQATVQWSDGHTGVYPHSWLKDHQLPPALRPSQEILNFREFKYVSDDFNHPTVDFQEVMETSDGLALWLAHIVDYGYCMVRGVPLEPEITQGLLERIAFIRHTHYGGFWDFTSDLTYKDTAYTSEALDVHTDNTYFSDPARLQLFHLLSHTGGEGGETLLVDGFRAAAVMYAESQANVKALANIPQPWHSSGNDDVCIQPYQLFPVFERDESTAILRRIRWNNYDRAVKVDWTPQEAELWYEAARHYNNIINRANIKIKMQLEPGTAFIFDNWRMLHGRTEFRGKRRMCGGYINNDDFISRYRLLRDGREKTLNKIGTLDTRITC